MLASQVLDSKQDGGDNEELNQIMKPGKAQNPSEKPKLALSIRDPRIKVTQPSQKPVVVNGVP